MNQLSTLALLMGKPAKFYEGKCTPYEAGLLGGAISRERKLKRLEEIRPKMLEMLRNYRTYTDMAREIGVSKVTIQVYIKGDPEFKRLASLYVKVGGYRGRRAR
ncbi:hypothetical protein SAMN05216404_106205 [Nitrosospira multiformis]|uniref:Uncharacterized protein n=1 Tax=Nitrosospira multiformis TaxID=1231 RepID=A0A1H8IVW4_9PROT|nr:hypothetical protein [Nitrosospira multiformis]SEN72763.1 hypothetical protein SAMN05216404_106205 [Nitrosospira multiformis]